MTCGRIYSCVADDFLIATAALWLRKADSSEMPVAFVVLRTKLTMCCRRNWKWMPEFADQLAENSSVTIGTFINLNVADEIVGRCGPNERDLRTF